MRPERVEEITRRFNAYVEENIDPITLQPQVEIDSELFFSNITPAFRRDLNRFQPFGPGNPAPVFVTRGVVSHGETKLVGADCEHLRLSSSRLTRMLYCVHILLPYRPALWKRHSLLSASSVRDVYTVTKQSATVRTVSSTR